MKMEKEYDFTHAKRGAGIPMPAGKERITIRLDTEVLNWFRQQVNEQGGGNYQTMINQVLVDYVYAHQAPLEELLRRVVREELAQYHTE
jgi:uncharacterized protein (DUF4415 family)